MDFDLCLLQLDIKKSPQVGSVIIGNDVEMEQIVAIVEELEIRSLVMVANLTTWCILHITVYRKVQGLRTIQWLAVPPLAIM